MASKVAAFAIKFVLPFIPLDKIKKMGAPLIALIVTLNPLNMITWILLGLSTLILYFGNPFGVANTDKVDAKTGKKKKSFLKAFKWSFLVLIPYFFINWLVIYFILKILV